MVEYGLVMVKPDAVQDGHDQEILSWIQQRGMRVCTTKSVHLCASKLSQLYPHVENHLSFEKMVRLFGQSHALVIVFTGHNAVRIASEAKRLFRERYPYGYYGSTIHASDDSAQLERECQVFGIEL